MSGLKKHTISLERYKSLFDTLYSPLCLFASKYLGDIETSKDIVQEVFIKIWEKNPKFKNHNTIKAYFYKAVKNRCLDYLKTKQIKLTNNEIPENLIDIQSDDFFFSQILTIEVYGQLQKAIDSLPEKMAKVVSLTLKNHTTKEIAEELMVTSSTIRTQRVAAINKLRQKLGN